MILRRSYREFHSLFIKNKAKLRDRNAAVQGRQEQTDIVGNMEGRLKFKKEFQIP